MSTATTGRRIEHLVRHDLEAHGFTVVRAAGSKGPADLVAVRWQLILFIQVKRSLATISPIARKTLIQLADQLGTGIAAPVVATKPARKPITYKTLTGYGPKDWLAWEPSPEWRTERTPA